MLSDECMSKFGPNFQNPYLEILTLGFSFGEVRDLRVFFWGRERARLERERGEGLTFYCREERGGARVRGEGLHGRQRSREEREGD